MKAMILAAGRGERLRPLTDTLPKPLVQVAGKALIVYHLEKLSAIGVTDVVINHAWLGHKLEQALGKGEAWGLNIHYSQEIQALETAGGIKQALPLLGDEPFLVINGDVFIDNLPQLPSASTLNTLFLEHRCLGYLWLVENPQQHANGDFGFVSRSSVKAVTNTVVKPAVLAQQLSADRALIQQAFTFSGIGIYHPMLFTLLPEGPIPLGPLLKDKMALGQVWGELHSGFWCDVGTVPRLSALEDRLQLQRSEL
jgi:MurNAc alpha-1-phosphate uridylyltransferase